MPDLIDVMMSAPIDLGTAGLEIEKSRLSYKNGLTYFKLMSKTVVQEKFNLFFLSPTCFRHDGNLHLLPLPSLIFNGLVKRWMYFSDIPIPVINTDHLQILRYKLKTDSVLFNNYNLVGFKGNCQYGFVNELAEIERWPFFILLNFASIAGLGYKTTMGMGQVKVG